MLDIFILTFYLLLLLVVGIYQRRDNSAKGLGRIAKISSNLQHNKIMLLATIFASSIGGGTIFGVSEKVFSTNIAYSCALILAIIPDLLIARYIIPRLTGGHTNAQTVGDLMHKYYGAEGRFIGGIAAVFVSIGILAAQVSVSGRIFQYILGIDYILGAMLSYGIVVIYTTIGGLQSIIFTNLIQFFVVIIAIPCITLITLSQMGIGQFLEALPASKFTSISVDYGIGKEIFFYFLAFSCINMLPTFLQRVTMTQDVKKIQNAIYIKSGIYFIFLVLVTVNGLIAYINYPEYPPSLALPHLISETIPIGLRGFVVVGLLAAVMSTADSDLNIVSISLVKDVIDPIASIKDSRTILHMVRVMNIAIGSLSIVIALYFQQVLDLVMFVTGFWGPTILPPLLIAILGGVIARKIFLTSVAIGGTIFLLWNFFGSEQSMIKPILLGTIANLCICLLGLASRNSNTSPMA